MSLKIGWRAIELSDMDSKTELLKMASKSAAGVATELHNMLTTLAEEHGDVPDTKMCALALSAQQALLELCRELGMSREEVLGQVVHGIDARIARQETTSAFAPGDSIIKGGCI